MGAHNAAILEYAHRRTRWVCTHLAEGNPACQEWAERIENILDSGTTTGSLARWMRVHDGQTLDTFQTVVKLSGADAVGMTSMWAAGPRQVTDLKATYVKLNGSRRDFAGMVTYVESPVGWIGFGKHGDDIEMVVYYVVG